MASLLYPSPTSHQRRFSFSSFFWPIKRTKEHTHTTHRQSNPERDKIQQNRSLETKTKTLAGPGKNTGAWKKNGVLDPVQNGKLHTSSVRPGSFILFHFFSSSSLAPNHRRKKKYKKVKKVLISFEAYNNSLMTIAGRVR